MDSRFRGNDKTWEGGLVGSLWTAQLVGRWHSNYSVRRRGLWALKVARRASRVLTLKTRGQRWVEKGTLETAGEVLCQIGGERVIV